MTQQKRRDRCQPISIKLQSGDRVYVLIIENAEMLDAGDSECYCYASYRITGNGYFKSPELALSQALERAAELSPIVSIDATQHFDEFFNDQQLGNYY